MAWLEQAIAAGYDNVALMKKDSDLDALRDRADFQEAACGAENEARQARGLVRLLPFVGHQEELRFRLSLELGGPALA